MECVDMQNGFILRKIIHSDSGESWGHMRGREHLCVTKCSEKVW